MMVAGRSGLHYGAVAMRVYFLAIFYVEMPVQILQQALVSDMAGQGSSLNYWRKEEEEEEEEEWLARTSKEIITANEKPQ